MAEEKKRKVVGVEDPKIETKRLTIFLIAVFGIAIHAIPNTAIKKIVSLFDRSIWYCMDCRAWSH